MLFCAYPNHLVCSFPSVILHVVKCLVEVKVVENFIRVCWMTKQLIYCVVFTCQRSLLWSYWIFTLFIVLCELFRVVFAREDGGTCPGHWILRYCIALNGLFCADVLLSLDLVPFTDFTYKYHPGIVVLLFSFTVVVLALMCIIMYCWWWWYKNDAGSSVILSGFTYLWISEALNLESKLDC